MDLLIDLPCRRLRLVLDEGSDRLALLAELRARRGADPPRCLADPGRPCGPGRPCAFRSRRDRADRRAPGSARRGPAADRPSANGPIHTRAPRVGERGRRTGRLPAREGHLAHDRRRR